MCRWAAGHCDSRLQWLLRDVTLAVIVLSLLGSLSGLHQLLDLCSHFRAQYFTLLSVLSILLWRCKSPRWATVALFACLHNAALIAPYYLPAKSAAESPHKLSLISFNVHRSNPRNRDVLEYLQTKRPDVIVLVEVNNRWIRDLSALNKDYPHRVIAAADDPFGIALYSKFPIRRQELLGLGTELPPSIWVELEINDRTIGCLGTHPPPPMSPRMYRLRNAQLSLVAETVKSARLPAIVAGDLNATPWCTGFQQLIAAGLTDTASGYGLQPTWNSRLPLMWIPIDHVLTTEEFTALRRNVGPNCGSDHYAVETVLGWN